MKKPRRLFHVTVQWQSKNYWINGTQHFVVAASGMKTAISAAAKEARKRQPKRVYGVRILLERGELEAASPEQET